MFSKIANIIPVAALAVSAYAGNPSTIDSATPTDAIFGDAKWIGLPDSIQPFHPDRLTVFDITFTLNLYKGDNISLIYGADDPRLMNPDLNIFSLAVPSGQSNIRVEIKATDTISIYRKGYSPSDNPAVPLASFPAQGLHRDGKSNEIRIRSNYGHTEIFTNGKKIGYAGLNPIGNGGDYIAFPALSGFGAEIPEKSNASISEITVRHFREPGNIIYRISGENAGKKMTAARYRPMPELRTFFTTETGKNIANATMTVTARGIYDMDINGNAVTADYFNPAYTQYNKTHTYRNIDVTRLVKTGNNSIHAILGEGWWSGPHTFVGENWNFFGDRQSLIAKLEITYNDGSVQEIVTSPETWQVRTDSPVKAAGFFQGEIYDARVAAEPGKWTAAAEIKLNGTVSDAVGKWNDITFTEAGTDLILPLDTLTAVGMTEPRPGVYVYDMGQNFAGVPLLHLKGLNPGTGISMRYGEVLYPDMPQYASNKGMVMTENLRAAQNHDIYIAAGDNESFSPRLTLHGYRFIEITGVDTPPALCDVKGIPLSSISKVKAHFECSDTLVNRLWKNIIWSTLSNFVSIPTDCAQRNERLGWMGDISVFAPAATLIADLEDLLARYLTSVRDCTGPDGRFPDVAPTGFGFGGLLWGSAGITVPWEHYRQYGDTTLIRKHYPAMKKYIDYLLDKTIDSSTGLIVQNRQWGDLGDWLSPVYEKDDKSLLWECYLIHILDIMSNFATILSKEDDSLVFRQLKEKRSVFFNNTYIDRRTGQTIASSFVPERKGLLVDTQASYALPIAFGINREPKVIESFINTICRKDTTDSAVECPPYSLLTGFIGTAWINEALSEIGRPDLAYRLLTSVSWPSWLYPVTQGATTIWERLDSYTHERGFGSNNSMNSFNHYSFGSVASWMITRALGIRSNPGIDNHTVVIAPEPDTSGSLSYARGHVDIPAGRVTSAWKITGDTVTYDVSIPEGVIARFKPYGGKWASLPPGNHIIQAPLQR